MKRKNHITLFLIISLIVALSSCIIIFVGITLYMKNQSEKTINQLGNVYMHSINERVSKHFSTMVDLKLEQLDILIESTSNKEVDSIELREELSHDAQVRDFDALAYYYEDGSFEMLYGTDIHTVDADEFFQSMQLKERKISVSIDAAGVRSAVFAVPFYIHNTTKDKNCIGLVAKMPINYISTSLSLDEEDAQVYSFVVYKDGSFVVRSAGAYRENYFDRVHEVYEEVQGKDKETYIRELKQSMNEKKDYSAMFKMVGEWRQIYCSSLPLSEWYLITIMPYGTLNKAIEQNNRDSLNLFVGSCSLLLSLILIIFILYFFMNRHLIRQLEESKRLAEKASKSKNEFLSNMSHDIRTPMNAVVGMTAIALNNLDNPEKVKNALKKVELSSQHLLGLINDILDMSKIESGKMMLSKELVSLKATMNDLVGIVQSQIKEKELNFDIFIYDITSEFVLCDSVRLNQVLLNLVSNAIKFTANGGKISVALHEESSPKGEEYVRIILTVKDTGIGMTEEFLAHIFDSFVREDNLRVHKTEGTGLGMTITKYIVDAMGGTIDIASKLGVGTEFKVTLDLETASEQEELSLPKFSMLVVDDDEQLCESTIQSLHSIGVQAESTQDGKSAVQLVKERIKNNQEYQVILLDWKLPQMDGISTARALRKELGDKVPILLISAYDCSEIEEEAKAAGINGFLSKPLFKSTLYYGLKPYVLKTSAEMLPQEDNIKPNLRGKRILLAEDNEINSEIASELLKEEGLLVEWAENGQICYDMFMASREYYYDAILMDIRMPIKNGYEATEMIRGVKRKDASIPIIAMTADAFSEDMQRCLSHGMNAHIAKPIDIDELLNVLFKYIINR